LELNITHVNKHTGSVTKTKEQECGRNFAKNTLGVFTNTGGRKTWWRRL